MPPHGPTWQHHTMGRIGVISDIHSNLAALDAVIGAVGSVDGWWCLGDIVGYGPQPNEVIEAIRTFKPPASVGITMTASNDWTTWVVDRRRWTGAGVDRHAAFRRVLEIFARAS